MKKLLPVALVLAAGLLPACASSLPVLRGQAQERLNMSDWEGALKKYDEVLAKAPDDPQANYGRGVCLLNMGQPQQAETSLRRALAVMGHDSRMSPAICDRIAEAKVAQKDLAGFTEFVGGEVKRHGTSRDWLRQAKGLAAFGDADGAVSAFRQAEVRACDEANEDRYAVYIATADYYLSMRDQPSALRCTRYAAYLNHNKPEIEGRLKKLGRVPGPTEQINDLMNKDNRPYFQSAMYYMETGKDLNKALAWFDKAIEQNPSAFWVQHQKANCLAKLGRKQDAISAANKSIELAKAAKNDDYVALNQKLIASLK